MKQNLFLILSIALLTLVGCASTAPSSVAESEKSVSIERDDFNGTTWIKTPLFLSRQGITDTFPVKISFRALYKDSKREFIQLYVTKTDVSWGFYQSANGQDGTSLRLVKVDNQVESDYTLGSVTVQEDFALMLSHDYLEKMSSQDWKIKVYGKRNEGVFVVPASFTKGFLNKVNCFEKDTC